MQHTALLRMIPIFGLTAGLLCGSAAAEELTDAKEILKRADEAIKKVDVASYSAKFHGVGWVEQFVATVEGKAVVGPNGKHDVPRFYCEVSLKKSGSEESRKYTAGCNGDEYFLIDAETKKAHHDIDPVVLGTNSRDIQRVVLREFSSKEAFEKALESPSIELKGTQSVEGETCYEVHVKVDDPPQKAAVWMISTKDFLPRQIRRIYAGRGEGQEDGVTELTLSGLMVNPKNDKDPFTMVVPEGYTKTDEFAP